jgi:murein DD-endopeptidase MepM/ murein hydrolase activator NlpD
MTVRTRNSELPGVLVLTLLAAVSLSACSTSPRTEFGWDVQDHHIARETNNTFYGPHAVKLPPIEQHRLAPPTSNDQRLATVVPTQKLRGTTPGWYTPSPQPAPSTNTIVQPEHVADASLRFRWPLAGRVISNFGASESGERNDGINISAAQGEPVHAAASGTVSYCGNELKGYGNLVLIRHDNGYITAYAHVGSILVGRDDRVIAGQVIATAGATGDVAVPQLHFEIRQGMRPVDPKGLLPKALVVASS